MNSFQLQNSEIESRKNDIIQTVYEKILQPLLISESNTFSELKRKIDILNGTFSHVQKMFSGRLRDNWEDAFIHQIEVVELLFQYSENPTFEKVLILLEHDTIEDTDISISWMRESHKDDNVVFSVALMTKKPFTEYIDNPEDFKIFNNIKKMWILNIKWNINDSFNDRLIENNITKDEKLSHELYEELWSNYKSIRNKDYFKNIQSYKSFLEHALRININEGFQLSLEEIETNIINALECKLIDRLHWIITLWNCSLVKIKRKIIETEIYFEDIALNYFPKLWVKIEIELEKIKIVALNREKEWITWNVSKILSNPSQINLEI